MNLTPANINDFNFLFRLRNDPFAIKASENTSWFYPRQYFEWLSMILKNPNRKIFIAEENNIHIGMIRYDFLHDNICELSWNIDPKMRHKGLGTKMVSLALMSITCPVQARIKAGNIASIKIAKKLNIKIRWIYDEQFDYSAS